MKKRLLSMILALGMMLTILPVNAITALAADDGMSGNCGLNKGNNVTYVLTQNNEDDANPTYTLTIKGSGNMENYNHNSSYYAPWMWKTVTQVKFEGSVTSIGNYAFQSTSLTSITIPDSVVSIGEFAFCNCPNLENVVMPNDSNSSLKSIGADAFYQCKKLKSITIPSSVISIGRCAFDVCFNQNPLKVYFPAELPNNIGKELNNYNSYVEYYYPGYKSDLDNEKNKFNDPSEYNWLQSVHYYCDVTIDANGGSFSDGTETKVVKKVWSKENLTQEQVKAIGVPKNAQKAFFGWKYNPFYITENLENVVIEDSMTFCADYSGNTVTLGQLNNGNELVKGNSYEFTVTINTYCADSGSPIKKLTFGDVAGTIKYKNGKAVGAEGLEVTLPDGGKKNTLTFTFTPNEVGQNQTLTAYLDGLKYKEEEYGPVTSSTTYSVRDRQNAEVTITGLDGTTVKAGEAKNFTVSVTPNDDTIDKVTFGTTSGEVQWSSDGGNTWTTVSGDVDYSALTGKKFRVVPAADAADGTVTVTITAKKAGGTEIAKTASFTVTAREHATVKINELNGKTIKQNKAYTFTVTVTAHDDGGETTLKFDNVAGLTHNGTAVTDAGVTVALTNQPAPLTFTLTPDAEGAGKTLTATLSTSGATDTATYTVSEYEHAKVTIDGLGTDLKQGESKDFTVKVDPKDDSGNAIIDFGDKNSEIQYKDGEDWKSMPSGGLKINLSNGEKPYDFRITPKNDGSQTLTATVKQNDNELDRVEQTYTVAKKDEPTTPGGGSTGDSGNTKPTPKPDEKPDRKIKIDGGIVEVNGKEVKPDEDGNITVKKGDEITVTVDKSKISDAQVFDQWVIKPDSVLNEVDPKSEKISFTMPAEDVTIEAMTRDASIEDDGPGILGTGALIATGVVGGAVLAYQGHMLGTELYLRYLLPHGAVIPQNRAELAVLLWQDAENPEPVSTTLYSDISEDDSAIQQAARWAVENDLMEQLDADEHPDHFDPFVPVTFSDSIRAWKKAQELKK